MKKFRPVRDLNPWQKDMSLSAVHVIIVLFHLQVVQTTIFFYLILDQGWEPVYAIACKQVLIICATGQMFLYMWEDLRQVMKRIAWDLGRHLADLSRSHTFLHTNFCAKALMRACWWALFNPPTPTSDWEVTSPNNIHTLSSKKVMRILIM